MVIVYNGRPVNEQKIDCPRCRLPHYIASRAYNDVVQVGDIAIVGDAWCHNASMPFFFVKVPPPSEDDVVRALQQLVNAATAREKAHPNDMVAVTTAMHGVVEATKAAQDVLDRWHDRAAPKYKLL